jgi:hypothetical protein
MNIPMQNDLARTLQYLMEHGELRRGSAFGIARKIIVTGTESLTPAQRHIYQRQIAPLLDLACSRCGKAIRIGEVIGAYENGGLCAWCLA